MEKNINITNTKENIIEMDIEIEGINTTNKTCFFVIKTAEVDFSFKCTNVSDNKWKVTIPKMPQIENTMYNFFIYMVIDGYYFEPYSGTINVIKNNEIYVKDISNKNFKPIDKENKIFEPKKFTKESNINKNSIKSIADKILKSDYKKKSGIDIVKEQKIKDILAESNILPKFKKGKVTEL